MHPLCSLSLSPVVDMLLIFPGWSPVQIFYQSFGMARAGGEDDKWRTEAINTYGLDSQLAATGLTMSHWSSANLCNPCQDAMLQEWHMRLLPKVHDALQPLHGPKCITPLGTGIDQRRVSHVVTPHIVGRHPFKPPERWKNSLWPMENVWGWGTFLSLSLYNDVIMIIIMNNWRTGVNFLFKLVMHASIQP